MNAEK
jgi:hypothetical protein